MSIVAHSNGFGGYVPPRNVTILQAAQWTLSVRQVDIMDEQFNWPCIPFLAEKRFCRLNNPSHLHSQSNDHLDAKRRRRQMQSV